MKSRGKMRHAVSAQMRGVRELHRVSPKFFPLLTLYCLFSSIAPMSPYLPSPLLVQVLRRDRRISYRQYCPKGVPR